MRKDDPREKTHFRSGSRVFCINGEWYFASREGDKGPYLSGPAAEKEMHRYASEMGHLKELKQSLTPDESIEEFTLLDPTIWDDRPDAV